MPQANSPFRSPAETLAKALERVDARRGSRRSHPADSAVAFKALARGVLSGVADTRRRAFAPHLIKGAARRHLVSSLYLAGLYRRRAAEALAQRSRAAA